MDPSPSSPPPRSCTTSGRLLRLSCSAPVLRARLPSPRTPPLQPVRKLPLRVPSAVILRSLPCPSSFFVFLLCGPSIRTGWYARMPDYPYTTMPSAPLAVTRRAKRLQPVHDVSDPRFHHFRILSILCQRPITFNHRDQ